MKIKIPRQHKQQQKWQSKTYITDDTRELDSNSLLVCTKSNQNFIDKIFKTTQNLQNDISDLNPDFWLGNPKIWKKIMKKFKLQNQTL